MTTSSKSAPRPNKNTHGLVVLSGLGRIIENYGQQTCDLYLEEFQERLSQVVRSQDRVLRLANDKYCLVLNGIHNKHHVELAGAKLERVLGPPARIVDKTIRYDYHAGFVIPSDEVAEAKIMLRQAEAAVREAATLEKPWVIQSAQSIDQDGPNLDLLSRLSSAMDGGEFLLYYQPKISAAYDTVVGAEGLLRWHDATDKRVVAPGEFIQTLEQSHLNKPLTEQLLRSAVGRCATWENPLSVAVNITPHLLETGDLVPVIADALDFYGLDGSRLVLEITERGVLPKTAFAHLSAVRELGVSVSIDDFGTGQCSLSYFRDLPADQLKVDQSFVARMLSSKKDMAIVRSSIELAHHCGMQVVAEGVEEEETAEALRELGCDTLQGFLFGRPAPPEQFEKTHLQGMHQSDEQSVFGALLG